MPRSRTRWSSWRASRSSGMRKASGYFTPWSRPSLTVPSPKGLTWRSVLAKRRLFMVGFLDAGAGDGPKSVEQGLPAGPRQRRGGQGGQGGRQGAARGLQTLGDQQILDFAGQAGSQSEFGRPGGDDVVQARHPGGVGPVGPDQALLAGFGSIDAQGGPVGAAQLHPGQQAGQLLASSLDELRRGQRHALGGEIAAE